MRTKHLLIAILATWVTVISCASPQRAVPSSAPGQQSTEPRSEAAKTLVLATRVELTSFSALPLWQRRFTFLSTPRLFNGTLAQLDSKGNAQPYLAEQLPQLNTDSWRVTPDGHMETTYRLKPNLTWHDGTPLAAQDFSLTYRILATPEFGASASIPQSLMEDVTALDDRTLVIKWKQLFADAGALVETFEPLPRHLLEQAFQQGSADSLLALSYWSRDYVAAGPYRVDRWEAGSFVEGAAFANHALGKPRIDRIKLMFIGDPNTVMANLLAENVHIAIESSIRYQQGLVLRREWEAKNGGSVLMWPSIWRAISIQLRPEYASPKALLDLRIRRALAHSLDRQALNDAVLDGQGAITDIPISPLMPFYPDIERVIEKRPYDPRLAEQLFNQAGFTKGPDGIFSSGVERFAPDLKVLTGPQQEQELGIIGSLWRQFGIDVQEGVIPAVQGQDGQLQATLPAFFAGGAASGERSLSNYHTNAIPRPENRWSGRNYGGWQNTEYDRVNEAFLTTLPRPERIQQITQMARILSRELPVISYYFSPDGVAHVAALKGPEVVVPEVATTWNITSWDLQ